jgi:hypothetical protein
MVVYRGRGAGAAAGAGAYHRRPGDTAAARPGKREDRIVGQGDAHVAPAGVDRKAGQVGQNRRDDCSGRVEVIIAGLAESSHPNGMLIDNTPQLREWVLEVAEQIRAARQAVSAPIRVEPRPGQCRPCGMREHCGQARV